MTVWKLRFKRKKRRGSSAQSNPSDFPEGTKPVRWLAVSKMSLGKIDHRFQEESVAGILYSTVEKVEPTDITFWGSQVVVLHLNVPGHPEDRYYMELCLSEIGIGLLEEVDENVEPTHAEQPESS